MNVTIAEVRASGVELVLSTGHTVRIRPKDFLNATDWGPQDQIRLFSGNCPTSVVLHNLQRNQSAEADLMLRDHCYLAH